MENNQMNFDPITGQPINQNTDNTNGATIPTQENTIQNANAIQEENANIPNITQTVGTTTINPQQTMQNIPTIEQSKQEFINNTQANSTATKEEKKDGPNIAFIVILFIIIFASIFFLFPYLFKTL